VFLAACSTVQTIEQIVPVGIGPLNQFFLPLSLPLLHSLFSRDSITNVSVRFVVDEVMNFILPSKAFHKAIPVFTDSLEQIICHSDIEGTVSFAGKYISKVLPHFPGFPPARE
jgi:hypothetical protein